MGDMAQRALSNMIDVLLQFTVTMIDRCQYNVSFLLRRTTTCIHVYMCLHIFYIYFLFLCYTIQYFTSVLYTYVYINIWLHTNMYCI